MSETGIETGTRSLVTVEAPHTERAPRHTTLVTLPNIEAGDTRLRYAMHTDNVGNLLRFLKELGPQAAQLKIQGRLIADDATLNALLEHPTYRFFLNGRYTRVTMGEREGFIATIPADLGLNGRTVTRLLDRHQSPESLAHELGYKTAWYNGDGLVNAWTQRANSANDFLPLIGGCDEFRIGSDRLSERELVDIAIRFQLYIKDSQTYGSMPPSSSGYTQVRVRPRLYRPTPRSRK